MTHDFRPGDMVEFRYNPIRGAMEEEPFCEVVTGIGGASHVFVRAGLFGGLGVPMKHLTLIARPAADVAPAPDVHPSRERALLSLGAAREALEDAIDHLIKAGQPEEVAGQCVVRTRTAAEGAQQCIQHATMAMYWLLHERLGS